MRWGVESSLIENLLDETEGLRGLGAKVVKVRFFLGEDSGRGGASSSFSASISSSST